MSPTSGHTPLLGLLLCFAITTSYPVIPQPSPTALHPSGKCRLGKDEFARVTCFGEVAKLQRMNTHTHTHTSHTRASAQAVTRANLPFPLPPPHAHKQANKASCSKATSCYAKVNTRTKPSTRGPRGPNWTREAEHRPRPRTTSTCGPTK